MLAAQAAFNDGSGLEDEDEVAGNAKLSDRAKTEHLQRALNMAASNGDEAKVKRILEGKGKRYVDVNAPDEEGTSPLIYASCFVSLCFSVLGRIGLRGPTERVEGRGKKRKKRKKKKGECGLSFVLAAGWVCDRDMKTLFLRFSMPARTWTSRTDTSGAR